MYFLDEEADKKNAEIAKTPKLDAANKPKKAVNPIKMMNIDLLISDSSIPVNSFPKTLDLI